MSFHYPTVNYKILLHFRLKRGEPPLKTGKDPLECLARRMSYIGFLALVASVI